MRSAANARAGWPGNARASIGVTGHGPAEVLGDVAIGLVAVVSPAGAVRPVQQLMEQGVGPTPIVVGVAGACQQEGDDNHGGMTVRIQRPRVEQPDSVLVSSSQQ